MAHAVPVFPATLLVVQRNFIVPEQALAVPSAAGLGHGQAELFFGSRSLSRTMKKWASMTSVAWRCQPCQLRPS